MIVKLEHMRAPGLNYCSRGARSFFQIHNLDWQRFITEGLPEEQLLATGDAMAIAVVEEARRQWVERAVHKQ